MLVRYRHTSAPVRAFSAYTASSWSLLPNTTSGTPRASVAYAGDDQVPPGVTAKLVNFQAWVQWPAVLPGPFMANSAPIAPLPGMVPS